MPDISEHAVLMIGTIVIGLIVLCSIILIYYIYRRLGGIFRTFDVICNRQVELQTMTKKFMEENEEFFIILDQFNGKFDRIIERQGKLGGILSSLSSDIRKHDKKVDYLLLRLGEAMPEENGRKDPHV